MDKEKKNETIKDGMFLEENKNKDKKKKMIWEDSGYDDPPYDEEFRPLWGPGSSYKPWIYGK